MLSMGTQALAASARASLLTKCATLAVTRRAEVCKLDRTVRCTLA